MNSVATRLSTYAIAAGAAVASGATAQAAVISTVLPTPTQIGASSTLPLDLNSDGTPELEFQTASYNALVNPLGTTSFVTAANGLIAALPGNSVVGPGSSFSGNPNLLYKNPAFGGNWANDLTQPSYVGLSFQINGAAHYGYVKASAEITTGTGDTRINVYEYAYNNEARASIVTTPEPSSLALLALGAAGVAAFRRRKAS